MLSNKEQLWRAIRSKAKQAEKEGRGEEWTFLAFTLVLPDDWDAFWHLLKTEPRSNLWIVKPSSMNRPLTTSLNERRSPNDDSMTASIVWVSPGTEHVASATSKS